ncbi:hypothetical protein UFOVP4_41 [uncultured Caudovirales phage]|uniref:Uncharacterized protein n=1 Tax=uncultured Caudovirales phage TaxID=2100421 RepID=A0A6J5TAN0_9CAUD|nr:hypothetical protein UFOVP4_41 [uncultured Caudovirales phage]CAB4241259.1 hypothetical protein UFOVP64_19 [uncultured Caudovirales phage]CAB5078992.1 hypothetical protein UFOVP145_33 [uncultured Caudovirales phage]
MSDMLRIEMPWPPMGLNPNAGLHWSKKHRLITAYRAVGLSRAQDAMIGFEPLNPAGMLAVVITFYPPDRRHRDDDNMIAAFKAGRDGVADGIGVNDRRFRPIYVVGLPRKPGMVIVEVPTNASGLPRAGEVEPYGTEPPPGWLSPY